MKIKKVKIKDFKVLKDVEQEINGANLLLIGDNGVGKSSFMQFIEIALGRSNKIPPNAEGEGTVWTDSEGREFKFHVEFKDGKPKVTVTTPEGLKDDRKSAIASIVGAIDFDINKFVTLSDSKSGRKEQIQIFKSLLPLEVQEELTKYEQNILANYEARTDTNRKLKEIEGFLKSSSLYGSHTKIEALDASKLSQELEEKMKHNNLFEGVKVRNEERIKKIIDLKSELNTLEGEHANADKWLNENELFDLTELRTKIESAGEINKNYHEAQELIKREAEREKLINESGELTALIDSSRQAIDDTITQMDSPVEGLMFDEDGLIYKGVPVSTSSLSTSEIIELGCKLKMADNPNFGVLLIEHGESIGTERLKTIQKLAKDNNWQIIMEQVERGTEQLRYEFMSE